MDKKNNKKIGFIPLSFNMAETGRAIVIAKQIKKLGFNPVFFSHGGEYEYLIQESGFQTNQIKPLFTKELQDHIVRVNRGEKKGLPYSQSFIRAAVKEEIKAFKEKNIEMIVSFVNLTTSISARVMKIPLIFVSPLPGRFFLKIPDNYENVLTRLIPQKIKLNVLNYSFEKSKKYLKPFNKIAKEYGLKPFNSSMDLVRGDYNLGINFLEFLNIFPNQQIYSDKDYVGISSFENIFSDKFTNTEKKEINNKINKHFSKKTNKILITMGSSGDKNFLINMLKALNNTNYRVIVLYANILNEKEITNFKENILFIKFVPSIEYLHNNVDLSVIHGGQGTVYSAAYAGKPVIGFPMNFEQHLNLEKIVGHGSGFLLSKKYFNVNLFLKTINKIFKNYEKYLKNAKKLADKLPPPNGDINAARRIIEIYKECKVNR